MTGTKTDNHNPAAKLEVRRYFLRRYPGPHRVLDCCQAGGLLWKALRSEVQVETYWGLDLKPKKGRLRLDSTRVLAQSGWEQNVIDIDTYGAPWKHWEAMLPHVRRPLTVFLTIGMVRMAGGTQLPKESLAAMGMTFERLKIPPCFQAKVAEMSLGFCLGRAAAFGVQIQEAIEASNSGNARYIGLRILPSLRKERV